MGCEGICLEYDKRDVGRIEDDVWKISRAVAGAVSFHIGLSFTPFLLSTHSSLFTLLLLNMTIDILIFH